MPVASRAYGAEDKQARRAAILDAAARLFAGTGGALPQVAEVARAAGLAKGTVYLYFRTKEAIFADLLLEGWGGLLDGLDAMLGSDGGTGAKVERFLQGFGAYLDAHPELMRLDALGYGVIERNLDAEALGAFKRALAARLTGGGAALERALDLAPGRGAVLLMRTYALTRGLWQTFGDAGAPVPPGEGAAPLRADFRAELGEALREYWRGALTEVA